MDSLMVDISGLKETIEEFDEVVIAGSQDTIFTNSGNRF
jgi:hypothetical protein